MVDEASARLNWSLRGTIGKLTGGRFSGEVDVARPHLGLRCSEFDHEKMSCALLGVTRSAESSPAEGHITGADALGWPLPVSDAYVRGNDLVASYRPTDDWPYAPQIYWQANSLGSVDGVLASMSLLVSVQTHLLDTIPCISVTSRLSSEEMLHIWLSDDEQAEVERVVGERVVGPDGAACCVIWRLSAAPVSYVEIMSASDFRQIEFKPHSKAKSCAEWKLMADFLEKGVIRRARVHAAILPRENDVELALECCRAMENSPLPLTT